jgi:hypothetical protein
MPFLAITLLWLVNSKKELPEEGRNHWLFNLCCPLPRLVCCIGGERITQLFT